MDERGPERPHGYENHPLPPDSSAELERRIHQLELEVLRLSTSRRTVVRVAWSVVAGLVLVVIAGLIVSQWSMHFQVAQLQKRIHLLEELLHRRR
jgi:hypothetical protein